MSRQPAVIILKTRVALVEGAYPHTEGRLMENISTVVGMDVHKETIVAGVLPARSEKITQVLKIENRPQAIEKLAKRLSARGPVEYVYEAGCCGFELYRQLKELGQKCAVVAPSFTPVLPGDKVKTDRRDAEKLARFYRAGELKEVYVPTNEGESVRELIRLREDFLKDRLRARQRLLGFLLRHGHVWEARYWTVAFKQWLRVRKFEWKESQETFETYLQNAEDIQEKLENLNKRIEEKSLEEPYRTPVKYLRCFKGVDTLAAMTLMTEVEDYQRFENARGFMSYTGLVVREYSSGSKVNRGHLTKMGNAHLRRILVESAWSYRFSNHHGRFAEKRRKDCPEEVIRIAKKAQVRLHQRFMRLISRNKTTQVAVVAVARELAGFVWAMSRYFPKRVSA
jgi:transposase